MLLKDKVNSFLLENDFESANRIVESALKNNPDKWEFQDLKSRILLLTEGTYKAIEYLEKASSSNSKENVVKRAELHITTNQFSKAEKLLVKFFGQIEKVNDTDCLKILVDLYESSNDYEKALKIALKSNEISTGSIKNSRIAYLSNQVATDNQNKSILVDAINESSIPELFCNTTELANIFCKKFRGRNDVYATQKKFQNGNYGYIPVHQNFNTDVIKRHFKGEQTIGLYLLDKNSSVSTFCIDIDIKKAYIEEFVNGFDKAKFQKALIETAQIIIKKFYDNGLQLYPERSGYKGYHLWGFIEDSVNAKLIRAICKKLLEELSFSEIIHIDLFPAQDYLSGKGFGNLVKLPLGIHRKTGNRSFLLTPDNLKIVTKPTSFLENAISLSKTEIQNIAKELSIGNKPSVKKSELSNYGIFTNENKNQKKFDIQFPKKIEAIFANCELMLQLLVKIRQGYQLSSSEVHVLAYILKPIGEEGEEVFHRLLSTYDNYDPLAGFNKLKNVAPNLISCKKVRMRLPGLSGFVNCNCNFANTNADYSSPLIYAGLTPTLPGNNVWKSPLSIKETTKVIFSKTRMKETNQPEVGEKITIH